MTRNPFHNRQYEHDVMFPLVGNSMLELGNKVNEKLIYKKYFESLGFRHISVDINGLDGALPLDLTKPLNLGTFDMVTNIGTSEHVGETPAEQERCWHNILEAMHVGSVLVNTVPVKHDDMSERLRRHGRWYPTEKFYQQLANYNGLSISKLYTMNGLVHARLIRESTPPSHIIPIKHIEENVVD